MKKLIAILAVSVFTLGMAQETPKKACCAGKDKKECSTKDKKACKTMKDCKDKKSCDTKVKEKKAA